MPDSNYFDNLISQDYLHSVPKKKNDTLDYYAEQEAELKWSVDQGVSRGLIDYDEAEEAKALNERTWWDRAFSFKEASGNMMGEIAQPLIDVLSLGNYAAAAATKATMDDPLFRIGGLKMGFTPSAWKKAMATRPYYSDMFESFGVGLAFDIAMDPLTYLTFGVGAGTKIGIGGLKKVGSKAIKSDDGRMTMTRYGQDMYRLAMQRMRPEIEDATKRASAASVDAGMGPTRHLAPDHMVRLHNAAGRYMVENYEELALDMAKNQSNWRKFKQKVSGVGEAAGDNFARILGQGDDFASKTVEDLFQETARRQQKEIGVNFSETGQWMAKNKVIGTAFKAIAPQFHQKLGVSQAVRDIHGFTQGKIKRETSERIGEIQDFLHKYDDAELEQVTRVLESGDDAISQTWDIEQRTMGHTLIADGTYYSDKVMEGAEFAKKKFKEILDRENAAGFKIDSADNYIQRIYKTRDARQLMIAKIRDNGLHSNFASEESFTMHRMISSLDEAEKAMGEGAIELNIGSILSKREAQSIRMINMEEFYDFIKITEGLTPLMVYRANDEGKMVAGTLKQLYKSRDMKTNRFESFDQVFSSPDAHHIKLGFLTDKGAVEAGGSARNLKLLRYLAKSTTGRLNSTSGKKLASELNPNGTAQSADTFNPNFKIKNEKHNLIDILGMEYSNTFDPGEMILKVIRDNVGDADADDLKNIKAFLTKADKHTREELDTPLLVMFPDLMDRIRAGATKGKFGKKVTGTPKADKAAKLLDPSFVPKVIKPGERVLRDSTTKALEKYEQILKKEVSIRRPPTPQLPEELSIRLQVARMNYGDFTDVTKPVTHQLKRIRGLRKKLEIPHAHMPMILEALTGKKELSELSARSADKVIEFLGIHADEFTARQGDSSGSLFFDTQVRKVTFGQRAAPFFEKAQDVGLKAAEKVGMLNVARERKVQRITRQMEGPRRRIKQAEAQIETLGEELRLVGNNVHEQANIADLIANLQKKMVAEKKTIEDLSDARTRIPTREKLPNVKADTRQFVGRDEILERNGSSLNKAEKEILGRKYGVKREVKDARRLLGGEALAPAFAARKAARAAIKAVDKLKEKLIKESDSILAAETRTVEGAPVGTVTRHKRQKFDVVGKDEVDISGARLEEIESQIAKLDDEALKIIDDTIAKFDSKVKILPGGRYMDKQGRVRDILARKEGKGKKYHILGKDGPEIRKAISAGIIKNDKNAVEFLEPALLNEMPDSIIGTNAGSYYLPKSTADFLDNVVAPLYKGDNPMVDGILRGYDNIQNAFKIPLLGPWFSTMARNAIGNVTMAYLKTGVSLASPEHLTDFVKTFSYVLAQESPRMAGFFGKVGLTEKIAALGAKEVRYFGSKGGVPITIAELVEEFGKRGVFSGWMRDEIFEGSVKSQKAGAAFAGGAMGGSLAGPGGALAGAAIGARLGKETYRMKNLFRGQELASEMPTRLMLALHTFKETGSVLEASDTVRHFLHDYGELSTFEKRYVRRAIPFYNFTKLAFKAFGTSVIDNPGRVLQPWKVFNSANTTSLFSERQAMPEDVPDFFHSQMVFMGKDIDEEDGKMKSWVVSGFNLPVQEVLQLTDIVAPGGKPISQLGSRTGFLATSVLEYVMNYDTFRGGPIKPDVEAGIKQTPWESGNSFKHSAKWMQRLVGYHIGDDGKSKVNPKYAWLMGEIPTSRFTTFAKKLYEDESGENVDYTGLAMRFLGPGLYKYDPKTQQFFQNRAKVNAMTSLLANIQALKSYDIDSSTFDKPKKKKKDPNPPPSGFPGY